MSSILDRIIERTMRKHLASIKITVPGKSNSKGSHSNLSTTKRREVEREVKKTNENGKIESGKENKKISEASDVELAENLPEKHKLRRDVEKSLSPDERREFNKKKKS